MAVPEASFRFGASVKGYMLELQGRFRLDFRQDR